MKYFFKVRWWMKLYSPYLTWRIPTEEKEVFITFDDGPTPGVTDKALDILKRYDAKATFFCLGRQVGAHTDLFEKIIEGEHGVGNHTYDHPDGWKSSIKRYVGAVNRAESIFGSRLFRPPYGKITFRQIRALRKRFHIIMWTHLSGDFDESLSVEEMFSDLKQNTNPGDIIVFHDNDSAGSRMLALLPLYLDFLKEEGYKCRKIRRPRKGWLSY